MDTNVWNYPPLTLANPSSTFTRVLTSDDMRREKSKLAVTLGISGQNHPEIVNLNDLRHVLIGGTTGSGKSTLLNTWICSLLMRTTPQEVRLILMDPKRVELPEYNGIPQLLTPVIQESDKGVSALRWAIKETDNRYKLFSEIGVRNIDAHNQLSGFQTIPYIVIFIDEFSDLICCEPKTEKLVCDLVQMGAVAGIHMVLLTSSPREEVYPKALMASFPTRIAFNVSRIEDSIKVLKIAGAEKLLGKGDMLIRLPNKTGVKRVQGAFISEGEINNIVNFLRKNAIPPITL